MRLLSLAHNAEYSTSIQYSGNTTRPIEAKWLHLKYIQRNVRIMTPLCVLECAKQWINFYEMLLQSSLPITATNTCAYTCIYNDKQRVLLLIKRPP